MESLEALAKTPPHNLEAEQSTLGSMLLDRTACDKAAEILQTADFYRTAHQTIFEHILLLVEKDEPIDPITVCEQLRAQNLLDKVGGREYVVALMEYVPTAANVEYYAHIVEEKAILRRLLNAASEIQALGYSEDGDVTELVDKAEQIVFRVAQRRVGQYFSPLVPLMNEAWVRMEELMESAGAVTGVPTGFEDLDDKTSGFQASDLVIIAARPSMGKTALALNIAVNGALATKKAVAIFSLEMSREQLVQRMICSQARVDAHRLRRGALGDTDWMRVTKGINSLWEAPLFIDDSPDCSAMAMRTKCRRLRAEHGLSLVVVDYLQLMRWHRNVENRNQEISEISRSLKSLARELKVPVVALSQLSRQTERREGNRPMLSDLRESGAIEAEADVVLMIYRPEYYKNRELRKEAREHPEEDLEVPDYSQGEEAEIIIAKQRNGPTGTVKLSFIPKYASFENMADHVEEPD